MAGLGPLTEQLLDEEKCNFADSYIEFNDGEEGNKSWPLSRINKKFMERTVSNMNNNNICGKSLNRDFGSYGILPSSSRELGHFADVKFLPLQAQITQSERPKNVATQDGEFENPPDINLIKSALEKDAVSVEAKTCSKGSDGSATSGKEIARQSFAADIKHVKEVIELITFERNKPLSVKERICNIDLNIEWLKSELALMKAQRLSLKEQFEQLFGEIMNLKLRLEMDKDEEEPLIEEETQEMSFETRF